MAKDRLSRKLAVILHADVIGSTSIVQLNESLAHERIQATFQKFSETIKAYGGIARELRGDALVAEFDRASDAVAAALVFQALNGEFNSTLDDDIQPQLRIGISLSEVIIADNTITGAGVVLAQRLEQLAESGGVVVQGSVSETVPARLPFEFHGLGEQTLKGFEQPVRASTVNLVPGREMPDPEPDITHETDNFNERKYREIPSLAVMPFTNLSNDPDQEYFGDGIADDISTALSKVSGLNVIATNSTTTYKSKTVDVKTIAEDLGVQFVLEGSIRRAGNQLRINAQLIEADKGRLRWSERYDRLLEDIFKVQDEITRNIVSELDANLRLGEQARLWSSGTENFEAWQCVRMGTELTATFRQDNMTEAMRLINRATELDPNYAEAWALLATRHFRTTEELDRTDEERKVAFESSQECSKRALEIDPFCSMAYSTQALCFLSLKQFEEATKSANKSVELAPNHARCLAISAIVLNKCGYPERAIGRIRKAIRLSPDCPIWFLLALGQVSRILGNIDDAFEAYSEMVTRDSESIEGYIGLAVILIESEMIDKARSSAVEIISINPDFSISKFVSNIVYSNPNEITRISKALCKAGLPE
jgi:adenylate cyclase